MSDVGDGDEDAGGEAPRIDPKNVLGAEVAAQTEAIENDFGDEYEIGAFSPSASFGSVPPGGGLAEITAHVDVRTPLAALFREAADEIEKVPDGD